MEAWTSQHWHLAWMIPAVFLIAYLGSPRFGGRMAFRRVKRLLEQSLDGRRYTQFHGIVLPTGGGRETLDHVVVSRFGVFVIVSEHRPGVLSGGESQEFWKQKRFGRTRRWPNPVFRAKLQMETLQRILEIPRNRFHLAVAVGGQDKPPKDLPAQVLTVERLLPFLRSKSEQLLSPEQADRAARALAESRLRPRRRMGKVAIAQLLLGVAVLAGVYFVYGDELRSFMADFDNRIERLAAPERFDESGRRKNERRLFEESLICAFSEDTMRCSCYEKGGKKVDMPLEQCRELAERGSILKQ